MNERSRYKYRKLVTGILGDVAVGAESPLEMRFLHDVERPHGLPRGDRQQRGGAYHTQVMSATTTISSWLSWMVEKAMKALAGSVT